MDKSIDFKLRPLEKVTILIARAGSGGDGKNYGFLLDNGSIILIQSAEEELLEIKSNNLMKITWHIGNRHIPCQIENERLLIQVDKVIENLIIKLGGSVKKVKEEFNPEGGAYGLGRTHGHKH